MATTSWPTCSAAEEPSGAQPGTLSCRRSTARSVSGSSPTGQATTLRPSLSVAVIDTAPCTTWLLVRTKPSGVKITPDPLPCGTDAPSGPLPETRRCTTEGAAARTASITVRE